MVEETVEVAMVVVAKEAEETAVDWEVVVKVEVKEVVVMEAEMEGAVTVEEMVGEAMAED